MFSCAETKTIVYRPLELAMTTEGSKPRYQDVEVILRLYEMRRETRMREARRWFASHFKANTRGEWNAMRSPGRAPNASSRILWSCSESGWSYVTTGCMY